MNLRPLIAAALLAGFTPLATANELLRIYEGALEQDMSFQAARHARDAAIEVRPQARAVLLPQLDASYGWQETQEDGTEGFVGQPETRVDRESTSRALTVTLNQTLFDWAAFKRYDQSGHEVALAQVQFRSAEQDLLLRTTQAYFEALATADNLRFAQSEKAAVERQLEQAQRRFDVGLSAITDVQEAQARYDLTVAQEITAEQQHAAAREALREITGTETARQVPLQEEIPLRLPEPQNPDAWLSTARDQNLELVASGLQAEIARTGIAIARAGHLPRVGAQAQYQDARTDGGRFTGESETESYGLQVDLPLFAGLATRSRVSQARATHEQTESLYQATRRNVERRTRDAYLAVNAGAARVRALQQAVKSSQTALEASQTGLEVGTRTAVDVLNAQSVLYSAQRDHARARYDYLLSILALKAAAGTLSVADLEQIDALLIRGG